MFCTIFFPLDFLFPEIWCIVSAYVTKNHIFPKWDVDITLYVVVGWQGGDKGILCVCVCSSTLSQLHSNANFLLSLANSHGFPVCACLFGTNTLSRKQLCSDAKFIRSLIGLFGCKPLF